MDVLMLAIYADEVPATGVNRAFLSFRPLMS
jgi:hypothetical protein